MVPDSLGARTAPLRGNSYQKARTPPKHPQELPARSAEPGGVQAANSTPRSRTGRRSQLFPPGSQSSAARLSRSPLAARGERGTPPPPPATSRAAVPAALRGAGGAGRAVAPVAPTPGHAGVRGSGTGTATIRDVAAGPCGTPGAGFRRGSPGTERAGGTSRAPGATRAALPGTGQQPLLRPRPAPTRLPVKRVSATDSPAPRTAPPPGRGGGCREGTTTTTERCPAGGAERGNGAGTPGRAAPSTCRRGRAGRGGERRHRRPGAPGGAGGRGGPGGRGYPGAAPAPPKPHATGTPPPHRPGRHLPCAAAGLQRASRQSASRSGMAGPGRRDGPGRGRDAPATCCL